MSKHSILLGTDGPDGNTLESTNTSTTRFITPSARVIEASASAPAGELTELQKSAFFSNSNNPSSSDAESSSSSSSHVIIPKQAWHPKSLTDSTSAPPARALTSSITAEMNELTATFAKVLAERKEQEDELAVNASISAVRSGVVGGTSTGGSIQPDSTATCFDIVTNTAQRLPLSRIISASAVSATNMKEVVKEANANSSQSADTFVVLTPVDWTVHDADSIFARLTSINHAADASDVIAIELATERDALTTELEICQQQLRAKDRTIELLRQDLKRLQEIVDAKQQTNQSTPTVPAATGSISSKSLTTSSKHAKIHDSESDDDDEEDDMVDEEDGNFGSNEQAFG